MGTWHLHCCGRCTARRRYDSSLSGFPWTEPGWLNGTFNLTTCRSSEEERAKCGEWGDLPLWQVPAYLLPGSFRRTDPAPVDGMSVLEVRDRVRACLGGRRGCSRLAIPCQQSAASPPRKVLPRGPPAAPASRL